MFTVIGLIILVAFVLGIMLTIYGYGESNNFVLFIGIGLIVISSFWMIFHP